MCIARSSLHLWAWRLLEQFHFKTAFCGSRNSGSFPRPCTLRSMSVWLLTCITQQVKPNKFTLVFRMTSNCRSTTQMMTTRKTIVHRTKIMHIINFPWNHRHEHWRSFSANCQNSFTFFSLSRVWTRKSIIILSFFETLRLSRTKVSIYRLRIMPNGLGRIEQETIICSTESSGNFRERK